MRIIAKAACAFVALSTLNIDILGVGAFQSGSTSTSTSTSSSPAFVGSIQSHNHYLRIYHHDSHLNRHTLPNDRCHSMYHSPHTHANTNTNPSSITKLYQSTSEEITSLPEERRQNLFQSLLRDLQIENVPLLGCDADAVHTMNAALWTTMAEISENDGEQKVCLVLENIPVGAIQAFVDDFLILKEQERLMVNLQELRRFDVSIVGKGAGPAIVIETRERTPEEKERYENMKAVESSLDESRSTAALQSFIDRIVVGESACPYTKDTTMAAVGLESKGITPGPVAYRYASSADACAAVGAFWNSVCELLATPQETISTTMLSLPGIGVGNDDEAHERFAAVMELISRVLCLFRGDDVFGLVHFHPAYDRSKIHPVNKPAYGHLPPRGWLRPMLKMNGNVDEAENLTEEELVLSDYQRRSPFTAINILRTEQLNAANGAKSIVDLDIGDGVIEKASGITTYSRNAIRLAGVGEEALQDGVDRDMAIAFGL